MLTETEIFNWFRRELFPQSDVLQLLDIDAPTLQNWANRGIITPQQEAPGRQGKRLYAGANLVALAIVANLTRLGVSPAIAALHSTAIGLRSIQIVKARIRSRKDGQQIDTGGLGDNFALIVSGEKDPQHIIFCSPAEMSSNLDPNRATLVVPFSRIMIGLATRAYQLRQCAIAVDPITPANVR